MWARIIPGIIGSIMMLTAFNWIIDPSSAAEGLSMSLLQGEGGNTQIGDFTSFFFMLGNVIFYLTVVLLKNYIK